MNRRDFLKKTRGHVVTATIAGVSAGSYAYCKTSQSSESAIALIKEQLNALDDKVKSLDMRTKKRLRFLYAATALSLGFDISMII